MIYTTCIGTIFGTVFGTVFGTDLLYKTHQQCLMFAADHSIKVQSCGRLAYSSKSNTEQATAVYRQTDDIHSTASIFASPTPTITTNVSQ